MPSTILHYGMTFDGPYTGLTPQEGVLIVDPATNTIRMGDGSTQGGVAIAGGGGGGSNAWADITGKPTTLAGFGITDSQATLVSGTNIKTINNTSLLGSCLLYTSPSPRD